MTGELIINGEDAWEQYGVSMGEGFVDALEAPLPLKEMIESDCRLEDGKTIITDELHLDSREVTLPFVVLGEDEDDFNRKRRAFMELLYAGDMRIEVPKIGSEVYNLVYKKSTSYGQSRTRRVCSVSVKFDEPNPANRT